MTGIAYHVGARSRAIATAHRLWRAFASRAWLALVGLVLMARGVHAEESSLPDAARSDPILRAMDRLALATKRTTLDNGLRVVMNTDPSSPTVAVSVTYDVGSRNEREGQSGFAHLFEHMMFQGSRHLKKGEHFSLVAERGGTLNGTTSADRTNYFELLPSSELELALFLEADRLRWLDVSRENFENRRRRRGDTHHAARGLRSGDGPRPPTSFLGRGPSLSARSVSLVSAGTRAGARARRGDPE